MKIYKYELEITYKQTIELPTSSKILSIQTQGKSVMMWVMVNELSKQSDSRFIECYPTGVSINEHFELTHLGTVQQDGLVWHFFERELP